jgi:hypothetical protein
MTQVDLGPAGIRANIEHYQSLVQAAEYDLERLRDQLDLWLLTQKEHRAKKVHVQNTAG